MDDAWNMTFAEMALLADVRSKARSIVLTHSTNYDQDRTAGLIEHLKTLGVEL